MINRGFTYKHSFNH